MRTITLVTLLLGAVALAAATNRGINVGGIGVDFVGQSGQIKLYPSVDSNNFIMIKQDKLEETTASGNSVGGRGLSLSSGGDAQWSAPTTMTLAGGIVVVQTEFTNTYSLAGSTVYFGLTARLYQNATTVMNGNDTVTVYKNSLKFNVNVTGWPAFSAPTNTLNYELLISSKGGDSGARSKDDAGKRQKSVVMQNGLMDMPTTAVVDGVAGVPIGVTLTTKGNKDTVVFAFPRFSSSVVYDPVMCVGCTDSSAGFATASSLMVLLASVAVALGLQKAL